MIYWLIFLILIFYSIKEYSVKKVSIEAFYILYFIIGILLCLRQGQGTDYYNYYQIYKEIEYFSNQSFLLVVARPDPLYSMLNWVFIKIGLPYQLFVAFFSFTTMVIQWRFFRWICRGSCISLMVFYATIALPYDFNAMRQGLTLALVLGILFPLLLKRRFIKFYILCVLISLIHVSALICMLMPLIYKINLNKHTMAIIIVLCIAFVLSGAKLISHLPLPPIFLNRISYYTSSSSTQILAIINRVLLLIPLFLVPDSAYRKDKQLTLLKNIIFLGFIVYTLFSFQDFIASRENVYFRVFEGYFLSYITLHRILKRNAAKIFAYYCIICCMLFTKEIASSMEQGRYENCNVFTYPYFSIFDDNKEIGFYRKDFGFVNEQL